MSILPWENGARAGPSSWGAVLLCFPKPWVSCCQRQEGTALLPAALRKLRGWADVEDEMEEMHVEDQAERAERRCLCSASSRFRLSAGSWSPSSCPWPASSSPGSTRYARFFCYNCIY